MKKNNNKASKLIKIVISRGLGEIAKNNNELDLNLNEISQITGQWPKKNKAKKSVANFKVREGTNIGLSVTLRKLKMYSFFEKLIHLILPRVKDFQGLSYKSFDGHGNYNFGILDQLVFPEMLYDNIIKLNGFNISIITTAKTNKEAFFILETMGLPLKPTVTV